MSNMQRDEKIHRGLVLCMQACEINYLPNRIFLQATRRQQKQAADMVNLLANTVIFIHRATLAFIGSWVSPGGNNPTLELLIAVLCVLACCYHTMFAIYSWQVCSGLFRPFTLKTNAACGQDQC